MIKKTKSYFARAFLRTPGQSNRYGINIANLLAGFSCGLIFMGIIFLILYFLNLKLIKESFLILHYFFIIIGFILFLIAINEVEKYWQGLEGEKIAHDEIEQLIKYGYYIINSFVTDKFDIDLIVVGPAGIFVVEVKNPKKYSSEDFVIYENNILKIKSEKNKSVISLISKDPIKQVKNNTEWIKRYLSDVANKNYSSNIKSAILFPNFWVKEYIANDLLIMNPKRFYSFLVNEKRRISDSDIDIIVSSLKAHLKSILEKE